MEYVSMIRHNHVNWFFKCNKRNFIVYNILKSLDLLFIIHLRIDTLQIDFYTTLLCHIMYWGPRLRLRGTLKLFKAVWCLSSLFHKQMYYSCPCPSTGAPTVGDLRKYVTVCLSAWLYLCVSLHDNNVLSIKLILIHY